ncbi:hypothetical protein L1765_01425 [Microaerobacter geothermalis]|uniref:hypothetical protein n=1 Tax=Microaerobacter geothermalis TaxID=674972 RepID=UPI001F4637A2|nr:hypothetical protein [Microaerobacter geothermalis]MCF6092652.1 hypothetical protein [Microaerobacter geothermalis]
MRFLVLFMLLLFLFFQVPLLYVNGETQSSPSIKIRDVTGQFSYLYTITPGKLTKDEQLVVRVEIKDPNTMLPYQGLIQWKIYKRGLFSKDLLIKRETVPLDPVNFPGKYALTTIFKKSGQYEIEVMPAGFMDKSRITIEIPGITWLYHSNVQIFLTGIGILLGVWLVLSMKQKFLLLSDS